MIYYDIQHHGDTSHLPYLIEMISFEGNFINISLDANNDIVEDLKREVNVNERDDIHVDRSLSLTWGGSSITHQMYNSLKKSLEVKGWKYFINLSGTCIPLKLQSEIISILNSQNARGYKAFCYKFNVKESVQWFTPLSEGDKALVSYARLNFNTPAEIKKSILKGEFDPARKISQRASVNFIEIEKNKIDIIPLNLNEINSRISFLKNYGFSAGRQWVILDRDIVEWLVNSARVKTILSTVTNFFISDEFFYQTALYNNYNPFKENISVDNLRFKQGKRVHLKISDLSSLFSSDSLFARKIRNEDYLSARDEFYKEFFR